MRGSKLHQKVLLFSLYPPPKISLKLKETPLGVSSKNLNQIHNFSDAFSEKSP